MGPLSFTGTKMSEATKTETSSKVDSTEKKVTAPAATKRVVIRDKSLERRDDKGKPVYGPPKADEVKKLDSAYRSSVKLGKDVLVRHATKGGSMTYFDAGVVIGDTKVFVPDSPWLRLQLKAGKLVEVKE